MKDPAEEDPEELEALQEALEEDQQDHFCGECGEEVYWRIDRWRHVRSNVNHEAMVR